jgi:hypothetical protein
MELLVDAFVCIYKDKLILDPIEYECANILPLVNKLETYLNENLKLIKIENGAVVLPSDDIEKILGSKYSINSCEYAFEYFGDDDVENFDTDDYIIKSIGVYNSDPSYDCALIDEYNIDADVTNNLNEYEKIMGFINSKECCSYVENFHSSINLYLELERKSK